MLDEEEEMLEEEDVWLTLEELEELDAELELLLEEDALEDEDEWLVEEEVVLEITEIELLEEEALEEEDELLDALVEDELLDALVEDELLDSELDEEDDVWLTEELLLDSLLLELEED